MYLKPKKKVALLGEWNTENLGDRAIGWHAAKYFLDSNFEVKLIGLGSLQHLYDIADVHQLSEALHQDRPAGGHRSRSYKFLNTDIRKTYIVGIGLRYFRNRYRINTIKGHLRQCDLVMVGGGALLEDNKLHFPMSLHFVNKVSAKYKVPVICLGCSSAQGASWLGRKILRNFVASSELVAVRDAFTQEFLKKLAPAKEIGLFGDFAMELTQKAQENGSKPYTCVAINFMHLLNKEQAKHTNYERVVRKMIREMLQAHENIRVTLFTTGDANDNQAVQSLYTEFQPDPNVNVLMPGNLVELEQLYQKHHLVISTRLHASIFAMNAGVPVVALYASQKIKNFFISVGLQDYCFPAFNESSAESIVSLVKNNSYQAGLKLFNLDRFKQARTDVDDLVRKE